MKKAIAAVCLAALVAAGCAHTAEAPDSEEAHPADSLKDANTRALNALVHCTDQYVDQNAAAAATASEIADASISHCGPELQQGDGNHQVDAYCRRHLGCRVRFSLLARFTP
jgi:hypothetical protein